MPYQKATFHGKTFCTLHFPQLLYSPRVLLIVVYISYFLSKSFFGNWSYSCTFVHTCFISLSFSCSLFHEKLHFMSIRLSRTSHHTHNWHECEASLAQSHLCHASALLFHGRNHEGSISGRSCSQLSSCWCT